jgi:DNA ligase (NAD+)
VEGDEITTNIKQIRSIPLSAKISTYGLQQIEIRGEVLINKKNFAKYNEALIEQGVAPLANPRIAASGTLRIKDSSEVAKRNLEALFIMSVIIPCQGQKNSSRHYTTHSGSLEMLWELGFRSPQKEKKIFKGIDAVIKYAMSLSKRDACPMKLTVW